MKYLKYLIFATMILGFFLLRPYHLQDTSLIYGGDDDSYLAHATSMVFGEFPKYEKEYYTSGDKMPMHSVGPAIMAFPFVFLFAQIDRFANPAIFEKRTRQLTTKSWAAFGFVFATLFYFCFAMIFLFLAMRYRYSDKICFFSILFMILLQGIPLYVYRRPIFSHIYEFFLQSALVYIFLKDNSSHFLDNVKKYFLVLIGILIGLIFLVRYNNICIAVMWPLVIFGLRKNIPLFNRLKALLYIFISAFVIVFVFRIYPILYNGKESYANVASFLLEFRNFGFFLKRIIYVLMGLDFGLFWTAPFMLIAFVNLFFMKDNIKNQIFLLCLPLLLNLYIILAWDTQGGWYGYRYLIFSLIPLLMIPFADILEKMLKKFGNKTIIFLFFLAIIPLMSMLSFEGNETTLTLTTDLDISKGGWGQRFYQLNVWKEIVHIKTYLVVLLKGQFLYLIYLMAYFLNFLKFLPKELLEKYSQFRWDILVKVVIVNLLPLFVYFLIKIRGKNEANNSDSLL